MSETRTITIAGYQLSTLINRRKSYTVAGFSLREYVTAGRMNARSRHDKYTQAKACGYNSAFLLLAADVH
jgi:hypothetical protein